MWTLAVLFEKYVSGVAGVPLGNQNKMLLFVSFQIFVLFCVKFRGTYFWILKQSCATKTKFSKISYSDTNICAIISWKIWFEIAILFFKSFQIWKKANNFKFLIHTLFLCALYIINSFKHLFIYIMYPIFFSRRTLQKGGGAPTPPRSAPESIDS